MADIRDLATAYHRAFSGEDGAEVLRDLMGRTFALSGEFHSDARMHAYHSGMRAVWLHIATLLALDHEDVLDLVRGKTIRPTSREAL